MTSVLRVTSTFLQLLLFGWLFLAFGKVDGACQSCLLPALHRHHHHHAPTAVAVALRRRPLSTSLLGFAALKGVQQPFVKPMAIVVGVLATQRCMSRILRAAETEKTKEGESEEEKVETESKPVSSAMVGTIGIYKNLISPLLPPACRFLPTCSQYGVQAIEQFGPEKGVVLTAWRILRCSPFGGKGYDPPKWPPVAYTYGSY
jgi:putative membrane protein insertion efficiency factor